MRRWMRAEGPMLCGSDRAHQLQRGDPVQLVEVEGMKRKLVRCALCAEGAPPPDLPPLVERQTTKKVTVSVSRLAKDYKLAQAGE